LAKGRERKEGEEEKIIGAQPSQYRREHA